MHWKAPTTILASLAAGIALSIGHHFFYASLNGTQVDNHLLFNQQINIGIGTAFAFLIKSCLVIAIASSFTQLLWRDLLQSAIPVSQIDTVTQILSSLFDLLNIRKLRRHKPLVLVALTSWAVPLATIIPPATLSIRVPDIPVLAPQQFGVAKINWTQPVYQAGQDDPVAADEPTLGQNFLRPSNDLRILGQLTAISQEIPTFAIPMNSSYSLKFDGPALKCTGMSTKIINSFDSIYGCNASYPFANITNSMSICDLTVKYLAWVPNGNLRMPLSKSDEGEGGPDFSLYDLYGPVGSVLPEPAAIYIATQTPALAVVETKWASEDNWSVLNCSFYHATYSVNFSADTSGNHMLVERELHGGFNYSALINQWFCQGDGSTCTTSHTNVILSASDVAYQSLMASFGDVMVGQLADEWRVALGNWKPTATSILDTKLAGCNELLEGDGWYNRTLNGTFPLARGAEQLFENMTLALLARSQYTMPLNSADALTEVVFQQYPNTYVYSWRKLALSYGIGILVTLICVAAGCYTMFTSGKSYSYTFSTIVRTTRDPAWEELIPETDRRGQDPRPESLGKAVVPVGQLQRANPKVHNVTELKTGVTASMIQKGPDSAISKRHASGEDEDGQYHTANALASVDSISLVSSVSQGPATSQYNTPAAKHEGSDIC